MNVKLPATTQNQLGASLPDEDIWTISEQKLLEKAIKAYPASDPERWDKVNQLRFVVQPYSDAVAPLRSPEKLALPPLLKRGCFRGKIQNT